MIPAVMCDSSFLWITSYSSMMYYVLSNIMFMYVFVVCHPLHNPFMTDDSFYFICVWAQIA